MTREEERDKIASAFAIDEVKDTCNPASKRGLLYVGFVTGAEWADAHPHWISVEDELPKDREMVLALGKFDAYFVACYDYLIESWFDENDTFIREDWDIAYWMPLPQAPKGGEE